MNPSESSASPFVSIAELRDEATWLAAAFGGNPSSAPATATREMASIRAGIRQRLLRLRTGLYVRGVFDPVLSRLDSVTVPAPPLAEIAAQLTAIASSLV